MQQASVVSNIIALWRYLGKKRRSQFFLLLILMLLSVVAEVVSIGAVVPFLSALTKPDLLMDVAWFQPVINFLEIQSADELLLPFTLAFVTAAVFSAGVRILFLWFNTNLTAAMGIQLRSDVYTKALYQPYEFHVAQNSSQLISLATEKVQTAILVGIMHVLFLVSASVMSIAIVVTLLLINTLVAVVAFVILGGGYVLIGYLVRGRIKRNGNVIAKNQPQSVKCMQEGLGGIREVIIDNSQDVFSQSYQQSASNIQLAVMQNSFLSGLPKSLIEMLGITLIALLAYSLQINSSGQQNVLPMLGALALGAQRLLPSLQQIYFSWSCINGNHAILTEVVTQLYYKSSATATNNQLIKPLGFSKNIIVHDLSFKYAGSDIHVLQNIELNILKGSRVGFIGTTGSGKSTLLDIIMGLLSPTQGQLMVDDIVIDKSNIRSWQRNIAHVSQSIFLSDASMAENIAFGIPSDKVDLEQVKRAATQAQIDEYIDGLPKGYQTLVGERGVRLSGGQRQRIGVARALYKQASVLILDEATSALDGKTEKNLMDAIDNINKNMTIIIIAHRLSTLEGCDSVIELSQGKIVYEGSYEDMLT